MYNIYRHYETLPKNCIVNLIFLDHVNQWDIVEDPEKVMTT